MYIYIYIYIHTHTHTHISLANLRLVNQGKIPEYYKQTFPIHMIPDLLHYDWTHRKYLLSFEKHIQRISSYIIVFDPVVRVSAKLKVCRSLLKVEKSVIKYFNIITEKMMLMHLKTLTK